MKSSEAHDNGRHKSMSAWGSIQDRTEGGKCVRCHSCPYVLLCSSTKVTQICVRVAFINVKPKAISDIDSSLGLAMFPAILMTLSGHCFVEKNVPYIKGKVIVWGSIQATPYAHERRAQCLSAHKFRDPSRPDYPPLGANSC